MKDAKQMKEIVFQKEKIGFTFKVSELLLDDIKLNFGNEDDDFARDIISAHVTSFILTSLNETQTITVYRDRPNFLDWLLRRRPTFRFEFNAKEVLKNPPRILNDGSTMMYTLREL